MVVTCEMQHWLGDPVEHVFDFDARCTAGQAGITTLQVNYYDGDQKRTVSDTITVQAN